MVMQIRAASRHWASVYAIYAIIHGGIGRILSLSLFCSVMVGGEEHRAARKFAEQSAMMLIAHSYISRAQGSWPRNPWLFFSQTSIRLLSSDRTARDDSGFRLDARSAPLYMRTVVILYRARLRGK